MKGDCFSVAGRLVIGDPRLTLVHGTPVGQGAENFAVRYWHAWVELEHLGDQMVIDRSNDKEVFISRADYYRLGQLEERHVYRYGHSHAAYMFVEYGHFGPWEEVKAVL